MEALDVLVVGAGIGGLTAARALLLDGHHVRVVDQTRALRPAGAGISLWSNGVKVLNALGLGPQVAAIGGVMETVEYRSIGGETLCRFPLEALVRRVGQRPYPVRRTELQALLVDAVGVDRIRLGTRCASIEEDDDRATVVTEEGERLEADLVVAADGAHSRLRAHVLGAPVVRDYVGYHNCNGIVPVGMGDDDAWTMYLGDHKRVSTMPVSGGHYFFFDVTMDDPAVDPDLDLRAMLAKEFAGWPAPVQVLLEQLDPAATAHVAIHTHAPLDVMARGRVAIVGDAAHTTAPDLGQGGCQAMEDGLVLARYLRTTTIGVADALTRYSAERVPRTADVMRRALERAQLSHGHDPVQTVAWYDELATEDGTRILDGIARTIEAGPLR